MASVYEILSINPNTSHFVLRRTVQSHWAQASQKITTLAQRTPRALPRREYYQMLRLSRAALGCR
jgi:hypothetical protein